VRIAEEKSARCSLCGRRTSGTQLTKHHLRPKSRGGRETAALCRTCHGRVHSTFSTRELADRFDTVEKLRRAPELQGYLKWIVRQKSTRQFRHRSPRRR
jgi:hypothetical protein